MHLRHHLTNSHQSTSGAVSYGHFAVHSTSTGYSEKRRFDFVTWRDPLRKCIWAVDHRMWPTHRVSGPTCDHLWAVDYQCISPQPWVHPVVPEQSKINKYSISFKAEHSVVSVNPVNCQLLAECIKRITTKDSTFSHKTTHIFILSAVYFINHGNSSIRKRS